MAIEPGSEDCYKIKDFIITILSAFAAVVLLFFPVSITRAEDSDDFAVHGMVREKGARKPLEGITVYVMEREEVNAMTDKHGAFTLVIKGGDEVTLVAVGPGYERSEPVKISPAELKAGEIVRLYLPPIYSMTDVVVEADRNQDRTGKMVATGKELASVPGSAGDPLRGMQALPGITTSNDEGTEPAIRGSGPNDNAYYVDFLPVGYIFHMAGMQSVFNANLVDDFNIFSSAFGPEFANITGGVIDVKLRNPRTDAIGGKLNISMLESDALLEGPLSPDQSFYIAARRSYLDLMMSDFEEDGVEFRQFPGFYDYQGKYVWTISPEHTFTAQSSGAKDEMELNFTDESDSVKHDPVLAGAFNRSQEYHEQGLMLSSKLSQNAVNRLAVAHLIKKEKERLDQLGHMDVSEDMYMLRNHLNLEAGKYHDVLIGLDYGYGRVKLGIDAPKEMPSDFTPDPDYTSSERYVNNDSIHYNSFDIALKDRWQVSDGATIIMGGHATYEDYFDRHRLEPRLGAEYDITDDTLFTAGWGKYHQIAEGNEIINNGGNPRMGYLEADHYTAGIERRLDEGWSARIEGYYKELENLPVPDETLNYINAGSGEAYGTELLIKKKRTSGWSGWLSAGYSKTKRRNDLTGEDFPYEFDQPLIINLVYEWNISQKWTLGARWRYQTGAPVTPVVGTYTDDTGRIRPIYGDLRSERLPDYHRLDLRIKRDILFNTWKMGAYLDIINAYDRENISGYEYNADYTGRKPVTQLPLMMGIGLQTEF